MSYKDKAASGDYRGGRIDQPKDKPKKATYPCYADGCPMPGTMFPNGVSHDQDGMPRPGVCPFHYGVVPSDIPKVSNTLRSWECVVYEIDAGRAVLTGAMSSDPKAQDDAFRQAWERLKPLSGVWEAELAPGNLRTSKGVERPFREGYSDWIRRLERFIGARVVEVLSVNQHRRAA